MPAVPAGMIYARAPQAVWVTLMSLCVTMLVARIVGFAVPEEGVWFALIALALDVIVGMLRREDPPPAPNESA